MDELELLSRYGNVERVDPALMDATVDAILRSPAHPTPARQRSSGPRRRRLCRLVLAGGMVAAAVATAVVVSDSDGSSSHGRAPQTARPQADVLTAYVVDRSLAALATTSGYVERVVQQDPSGTRAWWRGPTQLLQEVPGQTTTVWTWADGVDTVLSVDYQHHTWSRSIIPAPQPPSNPAGGAPPPAAYLFSLKALDGPEPGAASIAALFRQPGVEVIGTATVDGTRTYQLQIPALDPRGEPLTGKGIMAWVNASSYLPLRMGRDMGPGPGPNRGAVPAWTQDFTWAPATSRALSVFDLTPPAGFHQTSNPALQPASSGRYAGPGRP